MEVVARPRMMELANMTVRVPDYGGGASSSSNGAFFARRRGPSYFSSSSSFSFSGGPDLASSEAVAALLRRVVLPGQETPASEDCCAVCLDDLDGELLTVVRSMPCSHSFHEGCIFRWLAVSRVCPCCRFPLPSAADEHFRRLLDGQPAAAAGAGGERSRTN